MKFKFFEKLTDTKYDAEGYIASIVDLSMQLQSLTQNHLAMRSAARDYLKKITDPFTSLHEINDFCDSVLSYIENKIAIMKGSTHDSNNKAEDLSMLVIQLMKSANEKAELLDKEISLAEKANQNQDAIKDSNGLVSTKSRLESEIAHEKKHKNDILPAAKMNEAMLLIWAIIYCEVTSIKYQKQPLTKKTMSL